MVYVRELLAWGLVSCALLCICGRDWFSLWKGIVGLRVGLMEKTQESWALRSEGKLSGDGELHSNRGQRSLRRSRETGGARHAWRPLRRLDGGLVGEALEGTSWRRRRGGGEGGAVGLAPEPASDAPELCGLGKALTVSEPTSTPCEMQ